MTQVLQSQPGLAGVKVQVSEGGRRGMRVGVQVAAAANLPAMQQALANDLFDVQVSVG